MKYLIGILFLVVFIPVTAQAQICDCSADLRQLNEKVKKIPAYKRNKESYEKTFEKTLLKVCSEMSVYDCFYHLNKLLHSLNDWHIGLFGKALDSTSVDQPEYPVYQGDLKLLIDQFKGQSHEQLEGIYHGGQHLSFVLTAKDSGHSYQAVVIESKSPQWQAGDILYQIVPLNGNTYSIMGAQYPTQRLISYRERIEKGLFKRTGFRKDTGISVFYKNPYPDSPYVFKEISSDIDYLKIGSFSSQYPRLAKAEEFYQSLEGKLNKPHLILDLRENGGGGDRNSDIIWKSLKKYAKKNKIWVLINGNTASNAEHFTLRLKAYDHVHTLGDRTKGALTYEIQPKDYHTLFSSGFIVVLPSKQQKKYLPYETKGIRPDIMLNETKSWISMVTQYIEENE
jgi:hypothetical protein